MSKGNFGYFIFMLSVLVSKRYHALKSIPKTDHTSYSLRSLMNRSNVDDKSLKISQQDSLNLYHRLRACDDGYIAAKVNSALDILFDALRLYGPDQLFSSYNGGKDAVVIMHLLRAITAKYSEGIYFDLIKNYISSLSNHLCFRLQYNSSTEARILRHQRRVSRSFGTH